MKDIKTFLANLTHQPGVYQMLDQSGKILYVGKARDLKKRVANYFSAQAKKDVKTLALVKHIDNIDIIVTSTENEALLLECNLIKKYQPYYNILFRDDKSYPYIVITQNEPYPRIDFYRGKPNKQGLYFGPYPHSAAVRETIHLIQKLFGLRTCKDHFFANRTRPCLHHQIGLCSGSCAQLISEVTYQEDVRHAILFLQGKNQEIIHELQNKMEQASAQLQFELAATLRDQISRLRQIQARQYVSTAHGDVDVIGIATQENNACIHLFTIRGGRVLGGRSYFPLVPVGSTQQDILSSFIMQHYLGNETLDIPKEIIINVAIADKTVLINTLSEQAKHAVKISHRVMRERKKWLEMAMNTAEQTLISHVSHQMNMKEKIADLKNALHLKNNPERIECFDISHTQGEETVASCVVFGSEGSIKNDYRRFNITGVIPGDDVGAMQQALERRYKRMQTDTGKFPDVIVVDGGKGQLSVAQQVLSEFGLEHIFLVAVAKGAGRKPGLETLHVPDCPPIHLSKDSPALHLIQQIRDEAHRFAITGHRHRRDKKRHTSTLESIPGIGAKRRRELLRYFGGIQGLNHASLEDIAKVPGISRALATRIFEVIH